VENVNGLMLALQCGFLVAAASGRWNLAGWLLGGALAVKPVLAPLVLVPLLWGHWGSAIRAVCLPAAAALAGLALTAGRSDFFDLTVPHLMQGKAESASIMGVADAWGAPDQLALLLRLAVVALAVVLVRLRLRGGDRGVSALVDVSSILLLAAFLIASYSWTTYVLYLIPLFLAVALALSWMPAWGLWAGIALLGTAETLLWWNKGEFAAKLAATRGSLGFVLIFAALAAGIWARSRSQAAEGVSPYRFSATAATHR
jgi:arabinofuranan 3-O-arabinosyltransferase